MSVLSPTIKFFIPVSLSGNVFGIVLLLLLRTCNDYYNGLSTGEIETLLKRTYR